MIDILWGVGGAEGGEYEGTEVGNNRGQGELRDKSEAGLCREWQRRGLPQFNCGVLITCLATAILFCKRLC